MKADPGLEGRLIEQEERFGPPQGPGRKRVISRGEGTRVWDAKGTPFLDFIAGEGVVNPGHTHLRIATALVEQGLLLPLGSPDWHSERLAPFLEKLCTLAGFEAALPVGSGAEAVEAAIQAARAWAVRTKGMEAGRPEIIVYAGNAHGGTLTLAALADPPSPDPRLPTPGFRRVPFGDLAGTRKAIGPATCAILVEPVQGAAGPRLPPRGFLRGLRDLCDARGLLLLADETRCGLGRTGRLFAFQHERIRPDVLALGPALAGGFHPMGALLASRDVIRGAGPGSPFGGSPLACAVASATLEVLVGERLSERSAELGAYFLARLKAMDTRTVREIRGLGLWAALELRSPTAPALGEALAQDGLLCRAALPTTLVLSPPLTLTREDLDWALDRLEHRLGP